MGSRIETTFTAQQRQAIEHRGSPLRIIAGAGTGKTATLTARFVHLVEHDDLQIGDILALTFTRKAANEMKERIIGQLDRSYSEFWVETFHAFCQRILRIERGRQGLPAPRVLEGQARRALLETAIKGHEFPAYGSRHPELVRQALTLIDRAKDEHLDPSQVIHIARSRNDAHLRDLATAYDLYQRELICGDRDFDWGELQTRLIETFEDNPATLQRWRRTFKHILVDEYQDINQAQSLLIQQLAGDGGNLTVVGDVDQSIYAFRGASHSFLSDMATRYPNVTTVHLSRNFRSHQNILDVANALIAVNTTNHREELFAHDARAGAVPTLTQTSDEHEEAHLIARQIARLHWLENVPLEHIAILLRSVQIGAGPIEHALRAHGLRSNAGDSSRSADDAVADVLAVLRLIDETRPGDLIRILTCQGIDAIRIPAAQIDAHMADENLVTALTELDPFIAPIARRMLAKLDELAERSLPEQVFGAAMICGRLPLGETVTKDDYRYVRSLQRTIERAKQLAEAGIARLGLIDELEAETSTTDQPEPGVSGVQIMTVHAAKGLEFAHVFVAGMAGGRFPLNLRLDRGLDLNQTESLGFESSGSLKRDADRRRLFLEEERRLGYVAATRASNHLYLSYANSYGQSRAGPSIFLTEIRNAGKHLLADAIAPEGDFAWSADALARAQHETIARSLDTTDMTGDTLSDIFLAQWTLNELPGASSWRTTSAPLPHLGNESLRLSFSALESYAACPRRYYYGYVLGLPDDRSSPYTMRGTAVHNTIQWMNEQRRDAAFPSEAQFVEQFRSSWKADGFESPAQERQVRQQSELMLRRFYAYERDQEREILDVEVRFDAPLGQHRIVGRIDCVSRRPDGTIEIIDYKTSKDVTKSKRELQLGIYQLAYKHLHPEMSPEAAIYLLGHKLDRPGRFAQEFEEKKQIQTLGSDSDTIDATAGSILETAGRILANEFQTVTTAYTCRDCAFRHVCEGANEDG